MYTIIKAQCIDQQLTLIEEPVVASGGVNADVIQFTFCELWDGLGKTAVFWHEKRPKDVYHALIDNNNECFIPHEVLAVKGRFFFGVVGVKDETRRTSTALAFDLKQGVGEEGVVSAPTENVYNQLLTAYAECMTLMTSMNDKIDEKVNAALEAAKDDIEEELDAAVEAAKAAQKAAEDAAAAVGTNGTFTVPVTVGVADTSGYYARNIKFSTTAETPSNNGDICFKLA